VYVIVAMDLTLVPIVKVDDLYMSTLEWLDLEKGAIMVRGIQETVLDCTASAPWMWFSPQGTSAQSPGLQCLHCPLVLSGSEHQTGAGARGDRRGQPIGP
jgi:hypothetical protein